MLFEEVLTAEDIELGLVDFLAVDLLRLAGDLDLDILIGCAGLGDDRNLVGAREEREWSADWRLAWAVLNSLTNADWNATDGNAVLGRNLHAVDFFTKDGHFLAAACLVPASDILLPRPGEGDWAAFHNQQITFLGWWLDAGLDLWLISPDNLDLGIDWNEHLGLSLNLDTRHDHRRPSLHFALEGGHRARFQLSLDLDGF